MPDHVHLVIEGTCETSDLRRCAKLAKQRTEYAIRTTFGIRGLWQEGYYERILRSEEATTMAVRYVLDNPVRAGFVRRAEDYPFTGGRYCPDA
jgi:REP element-mobilizing transposase RayT